MYHTNMADAVEALKADEPEPNSLLAFTGVNNRRFTDVSSVEFICTNAGVISTETELGETGLRDDLADLGVAVTVSPTGRHIRQPSEWQLIVVTLRDGSQGAVQDGEYDFWEDAILECACAPVDRSKETFGF